MVQARNRDNYLEAIEFISDYAAMVEGGLTKLRAAGLSRYAAESTLLKLLGVPSPYGGDDYDDYDGYDDLDDEDWQDFEDFDDEMDEEDLYG